MKKHQLTTFCNRCAHKSAYLILMAAFLAIRAQADTAGDLSNMSIEELGNLQVTSVYKRPEPLAKTPASVYVITQEDIRRSGADSLPEVLRLAPNLEVARVDAGSYSISARGFNTFQASNKLLVLIDGRSIYTPLHAGVYWDQEQIPLQDIERIEVVSGPGGSLWGSNAVNGVINVITRTAQQTTGGVIETRGGTVDDTMTGRFGSNIGENAAFRIYAQGFDRGYTVNHNGTSLNDQWHGRQAGFRTDWFGSNDRFIAQGDVFRNAVAGGDIKGENILTRWENQHGSQSHFEVQAYYDRVRRDANKVLDSLQTFDVSAQQTVSLGERQEVVWGLGHRVTRDQFINNLNFFVLVPNEDTVRLSNLFAQDTISLSKSAALTVGSKFEYSSFSGFEALPSIRLAWQARHDAMFWTAISRAVRTPSRIDRELTAPAFLDAAEDFQSETVIAYEAGYRGQISSTFSWSMSLYYNDYDRLRMLVLTPNGHFRFDNAMHGSTSGVEAWGDYQVNGSWRLSAGLNLIAKDLRTAPNAFTPVLTQHAGNDPHHQYFLRSSLDLPHDVEFDVDFRAIGGLSTPEVPSYNELEARLGWRISKQFNVSVVGFNLLDSRHPETGVAGARSEIRRSAQLGLTWHMK